MHRCGLAMVIFAALACVEGEGDSRAAPSARQLCALTIGKSSRDDVVDVLGPASATRGGGGFTLLQYDYGDEVAPRVEDVTSLFIELDEDGIFEDATAVNVPFPDCWIQQLRARGDADDRDD